MSGEALNSEADVGGDMALGPSEASPQGKPCRRPAWLAALLSLLVPGLGQWYAGRPKRTVAWMVGASAVLPLALAVLVYLPIETVNAVVAYGELVGYYVAMVVDAWRVARARGARPVAVWERWWACILVAVALLVVWEFHATPTRLFLFDTFVNASRAMTDTLMPGDRVIADKLWYRHQSVRHDEVVAIFADGPGSGVWVKRVVGLPGDVIEGRDEVVYRNGEALEEPYASFEDDATRGRNVTGTFGPVTVPEGEVFLLGDNRRQSLDSRMRGTWPMDDLIGPVRVIYWSHASTPSAEQAWRREMTEDEVDSGVRWERVGQRIR